MAEELGDKGAGVHSDDNPIKIYIARLDDQPKEKYFTKDDTKVAAGLRLSKSDILFIPIVLIIVGTLLLVGQALSKKGGRKKI